MRRTTVWCQLHWPTGWCIEPLRTFVGQNLSLTLTQKPQLHKTSSNLLPGWSSHRWIAEWFLRQHAWNVAATAKPCSLATTEAWSNFKMRGNSVTIIITPHQKTHPKNRALMCTRKLLKRQRKTMATSIRRDQANHSLHTHPSWFNAGQRLCNRF